VLFFSLFTDNFVVICKFIQPHSTQSCENAFYFTWIYFGRCNFRTEQL